MKRTFKRYKMKRKASRRTFSKHARVKGRNSARPMRGGIRL